ncbi:Uncharacterized protein TCM_033612 [Theobroma cacao]|uniref:Uncharacterized protein n=1 Tax=Theobroma cacao TaxID=3641 RepID=A0A061FBL8_THECC|nr:Uncharacterized protein TCM_033612 [Theobroma cacao]
MHGNKPLMKRFYVVKYECDEFICFYIMLMCMLCIEWHYWVTIVTMRVWCGSAHDGDVVCRGSAHTDDIYHVRCGSAHDDIALCGVGVHMMILAMCGVGVHMSCKIHSHCSKKLLGAGGLTSPYFRCSENAFSLQRETLRWLGKVLVLDIAAAKFIIATMRNSQVLQDGLSYEEQPRNYIGSTSKMASLQGRCYGESIVAKPYN